MSGDLEGQLLELPDARITFGRADDNVIVTNNPAVSSHHAVLVPESGGFVVYDLNSSNGTFVNDQQVHEKRLLNGDRIRIGIMEMRYELGVPGETPEAAPPEPETKPEPAKAEPEKVEPEKVEPEKIVVEPAPAPPPPPKQPEAKPKPPEVVPPKVQPVETPPPPPPKPAPVAKAPEPVVPPPAQKPPMRVELPPKEEKPPAPPAAPPQPAVRKVEPPRTVPAAIANFVPLTAAPPPPEPEKQPVIETPSAPVAPATPIPVAAPVAKAPLPPVEPVAPAPVEPVVPVKVVVTEIIREYPRDVRNQFEILPPVNASVFVQDAKQLVALRESSGQFVPFKSCWPAYDAMDAAQQRWYFYWRDVLRHEQYPATDTAYIFLHAYELINHVGSRNAADGFRQLHTLWLRYRGRHTRLDAYFVDWLADYVIVNPCGVDPLNIYFEAFELGGYAGNVDLLLHRVLATKDAPLPRRLLLALADYPLRYSKFYLDGNQKLLDELVLKAFQAVDARLMETEGQGILDKFAPEGTEAVHRVPFEGALCLDVPGEITVATVRPFSKSRRLRDFANAVVKHTENCIRELAGYAGRLNHYELSPDLRTTIENFARGNAGSLVKSQKTAIFLKVENRFSNQDTLRSILIRCSEEEKEGVRMASEQGGASLPPEMVEYVNHTAHRFLGDVLLFCKGAAWHVADDQQEDLKAVLAQRARTDGAVWQKFLTHLSDTQRRILAAVATQKIFSDEIRQLAGSRSALETVFHSINDLARKTIGEDLIDTLAIPPRIHREDAELIQRRLVK